MIKNIRMHSQQLVSPKFEDPKGLVLWMGAIQAQDSRVLQTQPQPPLPKPGFTPTDAGGFSTGLGGLFDDLLTPNPTSDAEEDEFRRRMQRKKKKKRGFGL